MYDLPLKQSGECVGWLAFYEGKQLEVPLNTETAAGTVDSLWKAKEYAAGQLKVTKAKQGLLAVVPAYGE